MDRCWRSHREFSIQHLSSVGVEFFDWNSVFPLKSLEFSRENLLLNIRQFAFEVKYFPLVTV
jgi:hypothetical protein